MNDNELNEYLADVLNESVEAEGKAKSAPQNAAQKKTAKNPAKKKTFAKKNADRPDKEAGKRQKAVAAPAEQNEPVAEPSVVATPVEVTPVAEEPVQTAAPAVEETLNKAFVAEEETTIPAAENEPAAEEAELPAAFAAQNVDAAVVPGPDREIVAAVYAETEEAEAQTADDQPLDRNLKLMSPGRMVARRFFRSKLSIIGLVIIVGLILFSWLGPVILKASGYGWGETDIDYTPFIEYSQPIPIEVTGSDGQTYIVYQIAETQQNLNSKAYPSWNHLLGTDKAGMDVFARLMYGGRVSLSVSILTVFVIAFIGIVFGGIAGYFGGKVDNVIMRICDILMCIPGLPIMLIVGEVFNAINIDLNMRIYYLMLFLSIISWGGTARLVRGQILYLREQEYMVAAEAMGFSTTRKIFKHLVPNVLPQLIVSMTLSLGSMILYEATLSYLGFGVPFPYASWGQMINIVTEDAEILKNYFNIWGPPGICIILAVLGFNFLGDGLRDALDPKMRR